jgi:hypothetical protein
VQSPPSLTLLAHQYGWDELLLFLLPIGVVLAGVRWVERRNRRPPDDRPPDEDAGPGED